MGCRKTDKEIRSLAGTLLISLALASCASIPSSPNADSATDATESVATTAATSATSQPKAGAAPVVAADPASENAPVEYTDIWARMRAGFTLPPLDSSLIARHEQWFASNPEYMFRMVDRAQRYLYYIVEEVNARGMPMEIALLPAIESSYKPHAYSRARAAGLWQFIPSTGRLYGLKMNWWYDGRRDVMASTQAALDYLEKLYNDFDGDWFLALAAYNAGEGKIGRAIEYNRARGKPTDFPALTRIKWETKNYVPRLMAMVNIVRDPKKYGVTLTSIPNQPYFTVVETDRQVDLGVVAELVDLNVHDLHNINPGYNRWATDPDGPHKLLVPVDKKDALIAGLSQLPEQERVQWRQHTVKRGETLSEISRRYGVSVSAIRQANRMHSNLIRANQHLVIPVSSRALTPRVTTASTRRPRPAVASAAPSGDGPIIYRVRRGDTLSSIARRYGVLLQHIIEWNLLDPSAVLSLGQRIKIWPTGAGPSAAIAPSLPTS